MVTRKEGNASSKTFSNVCSMSVCINMLMAFVDDAGLSTSPLEREKIIQNHVKGLGKIV